MLVIVLESEVPGVSTGDLGIINSLLILQGELLGDVVMAFFRTGSSLEGGKQISQLGARNSLTDEKTWWFLLRDPSETWQSYVNVLVPEQTLNGPKEPYNHLAKWAQGLP